MAPVLGPLLVRLRRGVRGGEGGGSNSARYCYSVWLRHLVHADKSGLNTRPATVVEMGPGDSLGMGLAALLSGSERYYALDLVEFANPTKNLQIFDELVGLFRRREPIPDNDEFPKVRPPVETYDFPAQILDEARLSTALAEDRLKLIRESILNMGGRDSMISYKTPWSDAGVMEAGSVDVVCSQAVMEHVDDLSTAYGAMKLWLKPGGYVSHEIDFKSHGLAIGWNGHWAYRDATWKLICGRRPYLLNREPLSTHVGLLEKRGFEIRSLVRAKAEPAVPRERPSPRFRGVSEDDLTTPSAFIQASTG